MAGKAKTIKVMATRNLDWINQDQVVEVDNDDRVQALLKGGYLVEADADAEVTAEATPDQGSQPL